MKVVINRCFGGFSVSKKVYDFLDIPWDDYGYIANEDLGIQNDNYNAYRADTRLINAIETLGEEESSGILASLKIVEIPDNIIWVIEEHDGMESIHEVHKVWY